MNLCRSWDVGLDEGSKWRAKLKVVSFLEHKDLKKNGEHFKKWNAPFLLLKHPSPQIAEEKLCKLKWPPVTLKNQSESLCSYTYSLRVSGMLLVVRSLGMRSLSFLSSDHNIFAPLFLEYSWKEDALQNTLESFSQCFKRCFALLCIACTRH